MFKLQRLFLLELRLSSVAVLSACATYSIVISCSGVSQRFARECRVLPLANATQYNCLLLCADYTVNKTNLYSQSTC